MGRVDSFKGELSTKKLAVIGLGYVGLPLAMAFAKHREVIGFDINPKRIDELISGYDRTLEVAREELLQTVSLKLTIDTKLLSHCTIFIVTVPTPIDSNKLPDFTPLAQATEIVGGVLKKGDIVIYESTVYPGATEERCVPILAQYSGLEYNIDFFVGYSPERISPGDKIHSLKNIKKITSGSNQATADTVDALYREIVMAGTHQAPSIKVAEAAKVVENTQRDLNIALMNELAIIFNKMEIDTEAVLQAAGTKWNFLPFRPGLVGGHCIGVDPYYLIHKAQSLNCSPDMILAGRRVNEGMGPYIVSQMMKVLARKDIPITGARILIMGLTFKENCPDLRNSRVVDIIQGLREFKCIVDVYDPWALTSDAYGKYQIELITVLQENSYDGIIMAVAHDIFKKMGAENIFALAKPSHVIYDLKNVLPEEVVDLRL